MSSARFALLGLLLLAVRADALQERALGVKRLVFELEVDVAKAREQNWAGKDASDEQLVAIGSRLVQRRFDAMQRAAKIELEPGTKRFTVSLPSIDSRDHELCANMLASIGLCEFLFAPDEESAKAHDIDLILEHGKLMVWMEENPDEALETFNLLAAEDKGPAVGLAWFRTAFAGKSGPPLPVLLPESPGDHIGAASFERVFPSLDARGAPAIGFELHPSRATDFERITEANVDQHMAILFGNTVVLAPTINAKLSGGGNIEGNLSKEETDQWIEAFQKLESPLRVVEAR